MVGVVDEKSSHVPEKIDAVLIPEKKPETRSDFQDGDDQTILASIGGMGKFPQPTTDVLDPLNWSTIQKHSILAIIMFK